MEDKAQRREKLDCPAVPPLEQKLANFTRARPAIGPAPRSAVLDKLATFLPQLAHENARLEVQMQDRPAAEFDIEHVDGDEDTPYIEMDLACGILELRDEAALQAAERAMDGQGDPFLMAGSSSSGSSSDEDDDDDDDDEDDTEDDSDVGDGNGGEGCSKDVGEADGQDPMGEAAGVGTDGAASVQPPGTARRRRAGPGRVVPAAAVAPGSGAAPDRRRKVAAKRSMMIEELS